MPRSSAWPRIAGDEAYRGGAAAGGGRSLPAARDVEYRNARARADRQFAGCRTRARAFRRHRLGGAARARTGGGRHRGGALALPGLGQGRSGGVRRRGRGVRIRDALRSEEHTSEIQSLMRNSYAVSCLKKKNSTSERTTQLLQLHTYATEVNS